MVGLALSIFLGAAAANTHAVRPADPDNPQIATPDPRLALPSLIYARTGVALEIYDDNVVLSWRALGGPYTFDYAGPAGAHASGKWVYTPTATGSETLTLSVYVGTTLLAGSSATIRTSDGTVGAVKALLVGDSGVANTVFPCGLRTAAGVNVTWLGTQTSACSPNMSHEGFSGKHFTYFATDAASPMTDGGGAIDIPAYLAAIGDTPDVVIWVLGYNYIYTANLGSGLATAVATEITNADALIAAWLVAAPDTIHALVLTVPGAKDDSYYYSTYAPPTANTEWDWRQKVHYENEQWLAHWAGDGTGSVWFIPGNITLDRVAGYTTPDPLHKNATGYAQIASEIVSWMAWMW